MKNEGYWVIRTYKAGLIGEKIKYWVPGKKPSRSKRVIKSDIRKQQQNENDAIKRVARIINANFVPNDAFDALTYSDPEWLRLFGGIPSDVSWEERRDLIYKIAEHELELALRRFRYACKKAGIECRYLAITSDMDGETQEPVRIHHHVIVSQEARELLGCAWKAGFVERAGIWQEDDHFGLAKYLMDQVRRIPDAKKYKRSRNLMIPEPTDRIAKGGREVQPPKNATILYRSAFLPGRPQYIRYVIPKPDPGGVLRRRAGET